MKKYRDYEEGLTVRLADPAYAKEYLSIALEEHDEDGNIEAFLLALRDVVNAQGGLSKLSKKHLIFFVNCGLIFLHGGGGYYLPLGSATAPFSSGITM